MNRILKKISKAFRLAAKDPRLFYQHCKPYITRRSTVIGIFGPLLIDMMIAADMESAEKEKPCTTQAMLRETIG